MAERRTEDSSIAPRRSLGASAPEPESSERAPLTERVSSAFSAAGDKISTAGDKIRESREANNAASPASAHRASSMTRPRGTRRARLRLTRLDPWSVMKTAFLLSIAFGIVTVVAVGIVWSVLSAAGVWDSINATVQQVLGSGTSTPFNIEDYVGTSRVLGFSMIVAVVDVVLITAIATLGAFLYNLAAALLGGIEVTLAEDDR